MTGPDDGTGASTGAPPPSSYPPCVGGACDVGSCIEVEDGAVCGASCTDATMCPLSANSDALPACVAFDGRMSSCALDCAGGEACPVGMLCDLTIGLGAFCVWP